PASRVWLGACVTSCAVSAIVLERAIVDSRAAEQRSAAQRERERLASVKESELQKAANSPATRESLRARQTINQALTRSWAGLFEALETAAAKTEGVTLTAVALTQSDRAFDVRITGSATSHDGALQYVNVLQRQPQIAEARITS